MRIRGWIVATLALALAPGRARAECRSGPECLLSLGIGKLDPKLTAIVGAGAAAVAAAAAAVSIARERRERPMPDGVIDTVDENGHHTLSLTLIPLPTAVPYDEPPGVAERTRPSGAFHFNDTAANVAIAVTGAAILGSVIAGFVKH